MRSCNQDVGKARYKILPIILHVAPFCTNLFFFNQEIYLLFCHLCHNIIWMFMIYTLLLRFVVVKIYTLFAIFWDWKVTSRNCFSFLVNVYSKQMLCSFYVIPSTPRVKYDKKEKYPPSTRSRISIPDNTWLIQYMMKIPEPKPEPDPIRY